MGVTVGWDVWAPVLRGEVSQGPSMPIQSRGRGSYGPCLGCSRRLVSTRGGLGTGGAAGPPEGRPAGLEPHTNLGFPSGTTSFLERSTNCNKLTAPKQADGDAGSGCPPAKRDRLISTHSAASGSFCTYPLPPQVSDDGHRVCV